MSGEQIEVTPEPTPAEAEAIRRALEALGLLEPAAADDQAGPGNMEATADGATALGSEVPRPR